MTNEVHKEGVVSVFLGTAPSKQVFDDYLQETYHGDSPGINFTCPLWDDLGVGWLDHDFQDAVYEGDIPVALDVFLAELISYIDSFRADVIKACARLGIDNVNAGVFLYNFAYPSARPFRSSFLRFVGTFPYTIPRSEWLEDLLRR
jgi:hypothetical protein